jgi:hypothetical protein
MWSLRPYPPQFGKGGGNGGVDFPSNHQTIPREVYRLRAVVDKLQDVYAGRNGSLYIPFCSPHASCT